MAAHAISSVRRWFPTSRIILATEEHSDHEGLDVDALVLVEDPGSDFEDSAGNVRNNLRRQLLSSHAGLREVETQYAVKVRTDIAFTASRLRWLMGDLQNRKPSAFNIGRGRIVFSNFTSVNSGFALPLPHHPCDSLQAGFTDDLRKLWSAPLPDKNFFTYFVKEENKHLLGNQKNVMQYRSEMWPWLHYTNGIRSEPFPHQYQWSNSIQNESENLLARNTIIASPHLLGVRSLKNKYSIRTRAKMYSFRDWKRIASATLEKPIFYLDPDSVYVSIYRGVLLASGLLDKKLFPGSVSPRSSWP